jgi:hypothetical protein
MSTEAPPRTPDSLAMPGLTPSNCMLDDGDCMWECAVQDADLTRGRAMSNFAAETGEAFIDISCRVAYLRLLTRQESYEHWPRLDVEVVPDDWEPEEDDAVWTFCGKDDPDAMRCWRLAIKATG